MKKILLAGLLAEISLGIIVFGVKIVLIDLLPSIFRPLTSLFLSGREHLTIPVIIVLFFFTTLILGFLVTHINIFEPIKIPEDIKRERGALVEFGPGAYYFGAVTGKTTLMRADGEAQKQYLVYCPSTPMPWTGLPIITVDAEKVILLKISYGRIFETVTSFGRNIPENLYETRNTK